MSQHRSEDGFTLVEVIASMVVGAIVFSALAIAASQALVALRASRDLQTATQLINQRMEQARALSYTTLLAGASTSTLAGNLTSGTEKRVTGSPYTFDGERLLTNGSTSATATPLNPYLTLTEVDGTTFAVATYATECWQPKSAPGQCNPIKALATDVALIRVTSVADWRSPGRNVASSIRDQSLLFSPTSCLSSSTHPFSAPCQPFFYAQSQAPGGWMRLVGGHVGDAEPRELLHGAQGSTMEVRLPSTSTSLQVEQVGVVKAESQGAAVQVNGEDVSSSAAASALASEDPVQRNPIATSTLTSPEASALVSGDRNLSLAASGATAQGAATAVASAGASPVCQVASGVAQATGRPCAWAWIRPTAASTMTLSGTSQGVNMATTLASIAPSASSSAAHSGIYKSAGTYCVGASGAGCVVGDARNYVGDSVVGGLPTGLAPPSGWLGGAVLVAASQTDAATESGIGASASAAPIVSGAPTMRVWNGSGYSSYNLASNSPLNLVLPTISVSNGTASVSITAKVAVGARSVATTGPAECTTTCETVASVPGVTATLQYEVMVGGDAETFVLDVGLLGMSAQSTFDPAVS